MSDRLTPERETEIAAAVAELDADRTLSFGTWTAGPVGEKSVFPPELAFVVEDVLRTQSGATIRGSVGVFGDERVARFAALARTAVGELLAELAAVREERDEARAALDRADNDVIGANLARWEEEQDNARLRLAWKSAQRGRRGARAELEKYVGHEPTVAEEMEYLSSCLNAVHDLCDKAEKQAKRWENPLPVPEWVEQVRQAADGQRPEDANDNRRRIYIDGKGNGWISVCSDEGTEWVVPVQPEASVEQDVRDVADETGSLREIGRCW